MMRALIEIMVLVGIVVNKIKLLIIQNHFGNLISRGKEMNILYLVVRKNLIIEISCN
jgi:hypothetical protein